MIIVNMNNFTLDLEITDENQNKIVLTHEVFSEVVNTSTFKDWLGTMNLKIEGKKDD